MNSLETISAATLWDIERYVLGDTSLDRSAFEASMSEDVELALAVADCVERMQHIAVACEFVEAPSQGVSKWTNRRVAQLCLACAALAAMLVAMVVMPGPQASKTLPPSATQHTDLSAVAAHWLALDVTAVGEDISALPVALDSMDLQGNSQLSVAEENDWMLEAAVAFYEQAEI